MFRLDTGNDFFTETVVRAWNTRCQGGGESPSLEVVQSRVDVVFRDTF